MSSRYRRAASSLRVSISHTLSRPWRRLRTTPAPFSTCRCFVTACRVTSVPSVSRVIDSGPPLDSRATRASRVGSPSAAKTAALALGAADDMALDVLHLLPPAALVVAERPLAACGRELVEARLHDGQQRAFRHVAELEHHLGHRLVGHVLQIDGAGMPAPGQEL